jgi:preprotein translocase subunit SecD
LEALLVDLESSLVEREVSMRWLAEFDERASGKQIEGNSGWFDVRLVSEDPRNEIIVDNPDDPSHKLHVERSVWLGTSSLTAASVQGSAAAFQMEVTFTDGGAALFGLFVQHHVGEQMAVSVDGHVISAPKITSEMIGDKAQFSFAKGTSEEQARRVVDVVNKAIARLATSGSMTAPTVR